MTCQNCRGLTGDVGPISWRGKCLDCAIELQADNLIGMMTNRTRERQRWRRALAKAIGAVLLEDLTPDLQPRS